MNINYTKVVRVEKKGTYTNINTKEKYIATPFYIPNNGENTTLKYGLIIPKGIYKGKGKNNYFIKEYDISDVITSVEPVRYSKTSPLYFKQGSNIY